MRERPWLKYNKFFRRQAAAEPARYPNWGEIDPSIWTQQFGRAIARPLCGECGSRSHSECPKEKDLREQTIEPVHTRPKPVCKRWNLGPQNTAITNMCVQSASLKNTGSVTDLSIQTERRGGLQERRVIQAFSLQKMVNQQQQPADSCKKY